MDGDGITPCVLHAAQHQDLRTACRHFQHFLVADPRDAPRAGHDPRIGGEHPVHVGVDLADVRAKRGGERDRRRVGGAPAKRRDVLGVLRHALEAGHDGDRASVKRCLDPAGRHVDDAGLAVRGVGDHAGLGAGERAAFQAEIGDGHRQQRHRYPLSGGKEHVQLAPGRQRAHLVGQVAQLIGGVAHGRHHHDHRMAGLARRDDALGHALDAVGVGYRGSTVLLHDQGHRVAAPSLRLLAGVRPSLSSGRLSGSAPGERSLSLRCSPPRRPAGRAPRRHAAPAAPRRRAGPTGSRRSTATTTAPRKSGRPHNASGRG